MVTGTHPFQYLDVACNKIKKKKMINDYKELSSEVPDIEPLSEPSAMGGFGFEFENKLINSDVLRYMTVLKMISKVFSSSPEEEYKFLEVGGGWGGLAFHAKKTYPKTKYVIIDIPHTLYFSVYYLYNLYPELKFYVYSSSDKIDNLSDYDFSFLPPWSLADIPGKTFDIALNQASLGEMTKEQVRYYSSNIARVTKGGLISHNRRYANPQNDELRDLKELLSKDFSISEIDSSLNVSMLQNVKSNIKNTLKRILNREIHPLSANMYEWWMCTPTQ
jgi:hypothetical protein